MHVRALCMSIAAPLLQESTCCLCAATCWSLSEHHTADCPDFIGRSPAGSEKERRLWCESITTQLQTPLGADFQFLPSQMAKNKFDCVSHLFTKVFYMRIVASSDHWTVRVLIQGWASLQSKVRDKDSLTAVPGSQVCALRAIRRSRFSPFVAARLLCPSEDLKDRLVEVIRLVSKNVMARTSDNLK